MWLWSLLESLLLPLGYLEQRIHQTHHRLAIGNLTRSERAVTALALQHLLRQRYYHLENISDYLPGS